MSGYIPDQGDIIWLDFDPSAGGEITKRRPALVISKKMFNERTGQAFVAPITSTERNNRLIIPLSSKQNTKGYILTYQARSLDFKSRNATKIENCDILCLKRVCEVIRLIIDVE